MNELVKAQDARCETYEALLLERDQLRKEAGQTWTGYLIAFGAQIAKVYEEKVECVRLKKAISFCQQAINRGGRLDSEALGRYLDAEMATYYENLKALTEDYERSRDAKPTTAYEQRRSKLLYRRLARRLHPDINPETMKHKELQQLWQRLMTAYHHNDLKALAELEVLINRALRAFGDGAEKVEIPDIEEKIAELQEEIETIKNTEPYTLKVLIDSPEATRDKQIALEEEMETFRKYRGELEQILQSMIDTGEVTIQWPTN